MWPNHVYNSVAFSVRKVATDCEKKSTDDFIFFIMSKGLISEKDKT